MKVRIIQSVDIKEVPSKLSELLNTASEGMYKLRDLMAGCQTTSDINSDSPLKYELLKQNITNLRTEMNSIEQELSDVDSILEGYIGIISEPATPVPPAPVPMPVSTQPEAKVGEKDANKG